MKNKIMIKDKIIKKKSVYKKGAMTIKIDYVHDWDVTTYSDLKMKNPILIEGMPGIGNVGKISMDILI